MTGTQTQGPSPTHQHGQIMNFFRSTYFSSELHIIHKHVDWQYEHMKHKT